MAKIILKVKQDINLISDFTGLLVNEIEKIKI